MIYRRLLLAMVAAVTMVACVGVILTSLAVALFALVEPFVGAAGAGSIVALAAALPAAILAALLWVRASGGLSAPQAQRPREGQSAGVGARLYALIKERPILSGSVAVGIGLVALLQPRYVGAAARAFLDGRASEP